jgi:phage tail-like protein
MAEHSIAMENRSFLIGGCILARTVGSEMPEYQLRLWDGQREYFGNNNTGLGSSGNVIGYREGGDQPLSPRKLTGLRKYTAITLKRGYTEDSAFATWAAEVTASAGSLGSEVSLANYRKSIYLEFYKEAGQLTVGYRISNGWVSEYPAMPPGGIRLHSLHLRNGKSVEEKLSTIFEESLSRGS